MIYNIKTYGETCLSKKSEPIVKIDNNLLTLLDDMIETMESVEGVGLAAPQIGKNIRAFVLGIGEANIRKVINPEILSESSELEEGDEGCLSVPGIYKSVKRPTSIKVRYTTPDEEIIETEISGFLAKAFQHEFDHLNGVLFVEKISPISKKIISKKLQLLKKETEKNNRG